MRPRVVRNFTVTDPLGMHVRSAALLVKTSGSFAADVYLMYAGRTVSARSILDVLTLFIEPGSTVTVTTDGDAAAEAMQAIEALFASSFDEVPFALGRFVAASLAQAQDNHPTSHSTLTQGL